MDTFTVLLNSEQRKRLVQTGNVWRPNIIKHCLVTKHADVEVSGQTVKTCLIKHRIKLHTQRTMGHKLTRATFSARDFSMEERETSQVVIQRFKLKKSIAAIILLEILEENGKRERRRGSNCRIPYHIDRVTLKSMTSSF